RTARQHFYRSPVAARYDRGSKFEGDSPEGSVRRRLARLMFCFVVPVKAVSGSASQDLPKTEKCMKASTIAEREARGRAAREHSKRSSHRAVGELHRNPIELLRQSSEGRVERLVPLRYGRTSVSPFPFFRGTAIIQAPDLSRVRDTGPT